MKRYSFKILIAEDDRTLSSFLAEILKLNGYEVACAGTIKDAFELVCVELFSLVLLDLGFPDGTGMDLLREIRRKNPKIPVIVITGYKDDSVCIQALKSGADDFIGKPVRQGPLLARIEAVLRRVSGSEELRDEFSLRQGAKFIASLKKIKSQTNEILLSHKEALLIRLLLENKNRIVSIEEIYFSVWQTSPALLEIGCIITLVSRLRKKILGLAKIEVSYKNGYKIVV